MTAEDRDLLEALLGPLAAAIEQVGLPLHILLEHRFGELNDNQLEMVEAAQQHAVLADRILRTVRRIRELSAMPVDQAAAAAASLRPIDLARAPVALAGAAGSVRAIRIEVDLPPDLPRVRGERARLEEALAILLSDAILQQSDGGAVRLDGVAAAEEVVLRIGFDGRATGDPVARLLARRLLESTGARLEIGGTLMTVHLPS